MVGKRHGDSSEGFNENERQLILAEADAMGVWIQGVGDDPKFMGRLVRLLMYTGIHVSVLTGWRDHKRKDGTVIAATAPLSSKDLGDRLAPSGEKRLFLSYRRPKKRRDNVTHVPVSAVLAPWIAEFLDQRKPKSRARYNQLLLDLQERIAAKGTRIHLNPHRFRHAALRLMSNEFGMQMQDVERITATTRATLDKYARKTVDEIADELADKGW